MNIIICGAGRVGFTIAKLLSEQGHSITVIDQSSEDIQKIDDSLDVKAIVGKATYPSILEKANASEADMIIAVTRNDEINMVICQIAFSIFNIPKKIARIRSQDYLNPKFTTVYNKENLPIDVIISPELEIAKSIQRKLEAPGALDSVPFAENKIRLLEILINEDCNLINIKLNEFVIIVVITIIGLISVCLGLDVGIKRLSQMNMGIAILLLLLTLILGPTVFIFNAMIQNAGVYVNQLIQLSTWTEAYNDSVYQNGYTLFYFTWWFAWAPFVSLFIARISYGRSIKEFIIGVLLVPSLIVFIWMGVFGNAAIYQVLNNVGDISGAVSSNASTALFVLFDSLSFTKLLSITSLILIVTFFVTSSDSGALVASMLSSKKHVDINSDSPLISRITWAILLGIVAAVLLKTGGLGALQTAVVIFGVPFSIITAFACKEFYRSLEEEL